MNILIKSYSGVHRIPHALFAILRKSLNLMLIYFRYYWKSQHTTQNYAYE